MSIQTPDKTSYQTDKLMLAAYLVVSSKADITSLAKDNNGRRVFFQFTKIPDSTEITAFFNGTATVSALAFAQALENLKSMALEWRRGVQL